MAVQWSNTTGFDFCAVNIGMLGSFFHLFVFVICSMYKWNAWMAEVPLFTSVYCLSHTVLDYICTNQTHCLHLFNRIDWSNTESLPVRADLATNHCSSTKIINQPQARSIMWIFSIEEILTAPQKKRYHQISSDSLLEQQITLK